MTYETKTSYELAYWQAQANEGNPREGADKYKRYLTLLQVQPSDLDAKTVMDVGAGPLGGILQICSPATAIVVDPLIPDYRDEGLLDLPSGTIEVATTIQEVVPDDLPACDYIICTNTLDHHPESPDADYLLSGIDKMAQMLAPGGRLLLWVHCREPNQLDYGHDVALSVRDVVDRIHTNRLQGGFHLLGGDPVGGGRWPTLIINAWRPID